ncbi:mitotic checkpoint serine/threonine-protein kinase BUB1 [Brienomyrus brachyistius]|uniref:mitotic checkpoint serine/threonine-protein kinase BUB1 n=1 Tax=Brienomyrus brachyistius TaxID=42636 RepID=UPI0020B25F04|nr:mitotic checkpoint serine/threonine-protein kinase BUB1 [Brienomyrus brachyistius]
MDIGTSLQKFEASLSNYTGDDPLDLWERYVGFLEKQLLEKQSSDIFVVLDRLVQIFLPQKHYHNDIRFINLCIKCASYYSEPIDLYSHIHSKGVGTRSAALYIAWAQQFERQSQLPQADVVYQRAIENQALPAEEVMRQYQLFQSRMFQSQGGATGVVRNPLQNSQLTNQMERQREPPQSKNSEDVTQFPADHTVCIISRSEYATSRLGQTSTPSLPCVSMYCVSDLVCEGSELCFEELRAQRYFDKCQQKKQLREMEEKQRRVQKEEEEVKQLKRCLTELENHLATYEVGNRHPLESHTLAECPLPATLQKTMVHPHLLDESVNGGVASGANLEPPAATQLQCTQSCDPVPVTAPAEYLRYSCIQSMPMCSMEEGVAHSAASPAPGSSFQLPPKETEDSVSKTLPPFPSQIPMALPLLDRMSDLPGCSLRAPQAILGPRAPAGRPNNQDVGSGLTDFVSQPPNACSQESRRELDFSQNDIPGMVDIRELSHGGTRNGSCVTPNTCFGPVQSTPSRVQPSPTVNTREALDVIMDMFQAPTFLQDGPFNGTYRDALQDNFRVINAAALGKNPVAVPFAIFQDENDKENEGIPFGAEKAQQARVLVEIPVSKVVKQNCQDVPFGVESMTDDSTVWGPRYNNTLAPCPNTTGDFALLAPLVSTPFHPVTSHSCSSVTDEENDHHTVFFGSEEKTSQRLSNKLSPILEESPPEEKDPLSLAGSCSAQGTILMVQHTLGSCSLAEPPPAALSFPEQTFGPDHATSSAITTHGSQGDWDVCISPEPDWFLSRNPGCTLMSGMVNPTSPRGVPVSNWDLPKMPKAAPISGLVLPKNSDYGSVSDVVLPKPDWLFTNSPERSPRSNTVLPMTPEHASMSNCTFPKTLEHVMSGWVLSKTPELVTKSQLEVPMSPEPTPLPNQDVPMSPEPTPLPYQDVPMSPEPYNHKAIQLVSDPWDEILISRLLSALPIPLSSFPNFTSWDCNVPTISPKKTVTLGEESFQVDCILGEGAFATVYQARGLTSSKKLVLKVQKPANPWEFYINSQLDCRLPSSVRHLFSNLYSAHMFRNGSVLLGQLHNCGTLLNAVNLYRNTSDKMMPQPLALYFAVCIIQIVEHLHSIHLIHADIKPDNFLLSERFLDNECFDSDHLDHGLVLIDLGQSIDMTIFPEGTAFTAKCMTSGFQCTEMLSGRPWNYQTDYFGIAGTVYCLIFGTYMNVKKENGVWMTNGTFKRNPHSELWMRFFHDLLNIPDCSSQLCLRSWRSQLGAELQIHYGSKLRMLKKRLVGQLLECKRSRR